MNLSSNTNTTVETLFFKINDITDQEQFKDMRIFSTVPKYEQIRERNDDNI